MPLARKKRFSDPDDFQAHIAAASPGVRVQPPSGRSFQLDLSLALLPRTALFSVESVNFSATRPAAGDLWSLTIPVRGGFSAAVGGRARHRAFDAGELFLLHQDRDFDYRAAGTSQVVVANLLSPDLQQKAAALAGAPARDPEEVISVASPSGGALVRFAHHLWAELQRPGGLWDCATAMAEMEDCLVSLLALAGRAPDADVGSPLRLATVRRAEDFLTQHLTRPVTRSELARAAGVSIRTVSRGFRERHGISPMAWLKARRLEAAQSELRAAVPGEVTVTEVALRYGFETLGRFSAEYRRRFGETPSQTLRD